MAFLHEEFPSGGAERVTIDVARFLAAKGVAVTIITSRICQELIPEEFKEHGIEIYQVAHTHLQRRVDNIREMAALIEAQHIEALVFTRTFHHLALLRRLCPQCRIVCVNHGMPFWEVQTISSGRRAKALGGSWKHRLKWQLIYRHEAWCKRRLMKKYVRVYRQTIHDVDAYIVLCDAYRRQIINTLNLPAESVEASKVTAIENSCQLPQTVNTDKEKTVVYVGRVEFIDKRVDRLMRIWKRVCHEVPDWQLVIVGDGAYRAALETEAQSLLRVSFVGQHSDVSPFYQRAAILCLTSAVEAWGLCLMEAQSYGVVPVAFGCSAGVRCLLEPSGVNGMLVEDGDEEAYAQALLTLMRSPEKLKKMQQNVLRKAAAYDFRIMGQKWFELLQHLVESPSLHNK